MTYDVATTQNGRGIEARCISIWGQKVVTWNSAPNKVDIDVQRQNEDVRGYSSLQTVYKSHTLPKIKTYFKMFCRGSGKSHQGL